VVYSGAWQIGRIYYGVVLTRPPGVHTNGHGADARGREGRVRGELEAHGLSGRSCVIRFFAPLPRVSKVSKKC
jgi:hypothetical protein